MSHLQDLKKENKLPKNLWITSSDNFASWGGGSDEYHTEDLNKLIKEVDYISMHTYPMHDTHYNPVFWYTKEEKPNIEKVNNIMLRARDYAVSQYDSVAHFTIASFPTAIIFKILGYLFANETAIAISPSF